MGPSGSGKTTLLNLIGGIDTADLRAAARGRHGHRAAERPGAGEVALAQHRLHLPALQLGARAHRAPERRVAPAAREDERQGAPAARPERARDRGPRRPPEPLPAPALGRAGAARGHRARGRERPGAAAGRRAHGRSRPPAPEPRSSTCSSGSTASSGRPSSWSPTTRTPRSALTGCSTSTRACCRSGARAIPPMPAALIPLAVLALVPLLLWGVAKASDHLQQRLTLSPVTLVFVNLSRNKLRTLLTTLSVAVALFLFSALGGVLDTHLRFHPDRQRDPDHHAQRHRAGLPAAPLLPRAHPRGARRAGGELVQLVRRARPREPAELLPAVRRGRRHVLPHVREGPRDRAGRARDRHRAARRGPEDSPRSSRSARPAWWARTCSGSRAGSWARPSGSTAPSTRARGHSPSARSTGRSPSRSTASPCTSTGSTSTRTAGGARASASTT